MVAEGYLSTEWETTCDTLSAVGLMALNGFIVDISRAKVCQFTHLNQRLLLNLLQKDFGPWFWVTENTTSEALPII